MANPSRLFWLLAERGLGSPLPHWRRALAGKLDMGEGARVRGARLDVRGANGSVSVGAQSNVAGTLVLEREGAAIRIGARTFIGGGTLLDASRSITVGDDVLISFDVVIFDHDSHSVEFAHRKEDAVRWAKGEKDWTHVRAGDVRIGDKAWIGARAIVMQGVQIGEGAVVGAGSVVTRSVDPWTVVAGNPARVLRKLEPSG